MLDFLLAVTLNFSKIAGSHIWKVFPCPTNNMLFLILACFNNFDVNDALPSVSNCRFVLSESINLQFDSEGRILLSSKLLKHAKIKNSMLFVGQGKTFQIWEPTAFEKFRVNAKKKSNIHRANLKWEKQFNN